MMKDINNFNVVVEINTDANNTNTSKEDNTMANARTSKTSRTSKENTLRMLQETGATVEIKDSIVFINGVNMEELKKQLFNQGTVNYTGRYRRFVMAQMFRALNYKDTTGCYGDGYNGYLKSKDYKYVLKTTEDELKVLARLQKDDPKAFEIRKTFFNPSVICSIMAHTQKMMARYLDERNNCGFNRFLNLYVRFYKKKGYEYDSATNLYLKFIAPIDRNYIDVRTADGDYAKIYKAFCDFHNKVFYMPDTRYNQVEKPEAWVEAFKASGAYYTLENMIYNHDCVLLQGGKGSKRNLEIAREKYCGHPRYYAKHAHEVGYGGWRLLGLMKETIKINDFDFYGKMDTIYGHKGRRW